MSTRTPPDFLTPNACNAWRRLYQFIAEQKAWDRCYLLTLETVSATCARYIELAQTEGVPDGTIEEWRLAARSQLASWAYIAPGRASLSLLNADGLDADIAKLCAPLDVQSTNHGTC